MNYVASNRTAVSRAGAVAEPLGRPQGVMGNLEQWDSRVIFEHTTYAPRQFEFHPHHEGLMVFGTVHGEAVVCDYRANKVG